MARIAVDIDSTLYDFDSLARECSLKLWQDTGDEDFRRGVYYSSDDWRAPAELLGVDKWLEVIAKCHDDEMILKQSPFPGSVETCRALMDAGHILVYISNRKVETENATREWLTMYGFLDGTDQCDLVVTEGDKRPFIKDCQYLIDDRLKTCVEFVYDFEWEYDLQGRARALENHLRNSDHPDEAFDAYLQQNRRRAFVPRYEYNKNATDIPRLYLAPSWAGLNVYMQRKGVLPEIAYEAV